VTEGQKVPQKKCTRRIVGRAKEKLILDRQTYIIMDAENITPPPSWSQVPDSIWLEILGHLDSAGQLVSLIEQYRANKEDSTHKRKDFVSTLGRVASDVSLWRNVKTTASRPSDLSKIRAFLGPHTTSLHILGPVTHKPIKRLNRCAALPKGSVTWITESFCQTLKLRCTRLKRLTLSNCFVDFRTNLLRGGKLPASIEKLCLIHVRVLNESEYHNQVGQVVSNSIFYKMTDRQKCLQEVHVSGCGELPSNDREALSKNKGLKVLFINGLPAPIYQPGR